MAMTQPASAAGSPTSPQVQCDRHDEQPVEIGPAERHVAGIRHRHVDGAVETRRGEPRDLAPSQHATPHTVLGVHGRAVGHPSERLMVTEHAALPDGAGAAVVGIGVHRGRLRVADHERRLAVDVDDDRAVGIADVVVEQLPPVGRPRTTIDTPGAGAMLSVPVTRFPDPSALASFARPCMPSGYVVSSSVVPASGSIDVQTVVEAGNQLIAFGQHDARRHRRQLHRLQRRSRRLRASATSASRSRRSTDDPDDRPNAGSRPT